jgi:hypothetical protein
LLSKDQTDSKIKERERERERGVRVQGLKRELSKMFRSNYSNV